MTKVIGQRKVNVKGYKRDVAANSLNADYDVLLKYTAGTGVQAATAGDTIVGISMTDKTFDSDNFTNDQDIVVYDPVDNVVECLIAVRNGTQVDFDADLVTSNAINMTVNWTAMTEVSFDTDNATTLANIATQLETDFPSIIADTYVDASEDRIYITPKHGVTLSITSIAVTWGASQATGTFSTLFSAADEGKYYDIDTNWLDFSTENASSGQLKITKFVSVTKAWVEIANT